MALGSPAKTLRYTIHQQLFGELAEKRELSTSNKLIATAILFSCFVVILETEETLYTNFAQAFVFADMAFGSLFLVEYLLRIWSIGEQAEYAGFRGRVRYLVSAWAIIDLAAILPFFLSASLNESLLLRVLRVLRLLTLMKAGRYTDAMRDIAAAVSAKKYELMFGFGLSLLMLLVASIGIFLLENRVQPEVFGSIPRALWWSVTSFTPMASSGIPLTIHGKLFAALAALAGIAMVTMPTAILAGAFAEAFRKRGENAAGKQGELISEE